MNIWEWCLSLGKVKDSPMQISAPRKLVWPVKPNRGVRGHDGGGDGAFMASRDGGSRPHLGIDLLAFSGVDACAPCECEVTHVGIAYAGATLGSIHLKGWGEWSAYTFKLLYVEPEVTVGEILTPGEVLGSVQDVAGYYAAKGVTLSNHVHFEVHNELGEAVDPLPLLEG